MRLLPVPSGTSGATLELSAGGVLIATLVLGASCVSAVALAMGPALAVSVTLGTFLPGVLPLP